MRKSYPFIEEEIRVLEIGAYGMEGVIRASSEKMELIWVETSPGLD